MTQTDMTQPDTRNRQPTPLSSIEVWIFDLDNTLYPAASNLFAQIDQRMTEFIGELFDLPWDEALTTLEAVTVLGTSDPEVAGWVDGARATFERLRATPLMDRLDEAVAGAAPTQRAPTETTVESRV